MLIHTQGIIFKSIKYRETSLILDIFTRELGLRTYVINGVRKKNATTAAALLQLMNLVDLVVYEHEQRDINRIKEVKSAFLYKEIPFNIQKSSVGLFMLEITRKNIKEKEKNEKLYDFITKAFKFLDSNTNNISNYHIVFLIALSTKLGFQPESNYSGKNKYFDLREGRFYASAPVHPDYFGLPESALLQDFLNSTLEEAHQIVLENKNRYNLLNHLLDYYKVHMGDFGSIKSLEIFRDIFRA